MKKILYIFIFICLSTNYASSQDTYEWLTPLQYSKANSFSEGHALALKDGNLYRIDTTGETWKLLSDNFLQLRNLKEGLAAIFISEGWSSHWGYIDKKGLMPFRYQFEAVGDFSEGFAAVKRGKCFFINKKGENAFKTQYKGVRPFSEGLAPVFNGRYWGYINKKGEFAVGAKYEEARPFHEGLAVVKYRGKWGFINQKGSFIIQPRFALEPTLFSEQKSFVYENKKWKFIDTTGKTAFDFPYDYAEPFSEGLAAVKIADQWGFINAYGELVIPAQFNRVKPFHNGMAAVFRDDKWGYINYKGLQIIPFEFTKAFDFIDGIALVKKGSKYSYITVDEARKNSGNPFLAQEINAYYLEGDIKREVKEYTSKLLDEWKKQGKYEKTVDYKKRVNPNTLPEAKEKLTQEAINFVGAQRLDFADRKIIDYNPDQEVFRLTLSGLDLYLPVPISIAPDFEQQFTEVQFVNPEFILNDFKFILSKIEVHWKDNVFAYDANNNDIKTDFEAFEFAYELGELDLSRFSTQEDTPTKDLKMDNTDEQKLKVKVEIAHNLPKTQMYNPNGVAVIIGNKDYEKTESVDFAINDARIMKKYLLEVMGYREGNIIYIENASKAELEEVFGSIQYPKGRLYNTVRPGISDVFIYYSGHGAPGLPSQKAYFVPAESDPQYIEQSGYDLDLFYKNLSELPAKSKTVILDACFSGQNLYENISTIRLRIKNRGLANATIFSSSTEDQVSGWYPEKQHGLFTYFFLKAIHDKNADRNKDKKLTVKEIFDFVSDNAYGVPYYARRLHNIDQTPKLTGDQSTILINY